MAREWANPGILGRNEITVSLSNAFWEPPEPKIHRTKPWTLRFFFRAFLAPRKMLALLIKSWPFNFNQGPKEKTDLSPPPAPENQETDDGTVRRSCG